MKKLLCFIVIAVALVALLPGTGPVSGAVKKTAKPPVTNTKLKKKVIDKTPPGFLLRPAVTPLFVTTVDNLPVLTFSANEDVRVRVEPWDGSGRHRVTGDILAATVLKKGQKINVAWTVATLPDGDFSFHIIMTDKAGNRTVSNAPFKVSFVNNQNRSLIFNDQQGEQNQN